eukprot:c15061_g1_i1 orf=263-910(+)
MEITVYRLRTFPLYTASTIFDASRHCQANPFGAALQHRNRRGQSHWLWKQRHALLPKLSKLGVGIIYAADASFGETAEGVPGPTSVFPRIHVRDPYKRLGVSRDALEEEIREARNFLASQYENHERSREAIEAAYDKIIMESFRERRRSKINLKSNLKKKVAESPLWVRNIARMIEVPSSQVVLQRAALFVLLGVWSVMNSAEGGPAFQVAVSLA